MLMNDARTQLRSLGMRMPPDVVRSVAQRIRNGETIYQITEGDQAVVAKRTANKIKVLLEDGKLGFLWEVYPEVEAIREVEVIRDREPRLQYHTALVGRPEPKSLMDRMEIFHAQFGLGREINVEYLERLGIPTIEALKILELRDALQAKILSEQANLADFQRLVTLRLYVQFWQSNCESVHRPPTDVIHAAAAAGAKGWVDGDIVLEAMARDVFTYQIWRGPLHLEAFKRGQVGRRRVNRYHITQILGSMDTEDGTEDTDGATRE